MTRTWILLIAACGSSPSSEPDAAAAHADAGPVADAASLFHALPFSGGPDAPVVASAQYRCRDLFGNGVVELELVVTDPQGPTDLANYTSDHAGMFNSDPPLGAETEVGFTVHNAGVQWELTYDGQPDSWGALLYQANVGIPVYSAICAAATWPTDLLAVDNNGHVTTGMVRATRVAPPN